MDRAADSAVPVPIAGGTANMELPLGSCWTSTIAFSLMVISSILATLAFLGVAGPAMGDEIFRRCGGQATGFIVVRRQLVCILDDQGGAFTRNYSSLSYSSGNLYGPRGGCYRLNSRGKKDYGAC